MIRFALILTLLVVVSCGRHDSAATDSDIVSDSVEVMALELPDIPEVIPTMEGKAGYLAAHFWDNLDFTDTSRSLNEDFMERNFVDFLTIMPAVMSHDRVTAFKNLLNRASASEEAYYLIVDYGDKYLIGEESPLLNEDYYVDFITCVVDDHVLTDEEKAPYQKYLASVRTLPIIE